MAQVAHPLQKQPETDAEWVDHWLYSAFSEWKELPDIEVEFETWDQLEQLDFIVEWPLAEMRLEKLQRYAAEEKMTPEQRNRYSKLLQLVEQNRPTLEKLLQAA